MSRPAKKKGGTTRLRVEGSIDYALLGISSHENDYRLVWAINQVGFRFAKVDALVVSDKLRESLEFSRFFYFDEEKQLTYKLISNRQGEGILFTEIKNLDYVMQITGELSAAELAEIEGLLKKAELISGVYRINPSSLKLAGVLAD